MSKPWVVVADQSKARIFTIEDPRAPLQELDQLEHPEARERTQNMTSDRPGRSFDSSGIGRHAMGTSVEPKEQDAIRFAKLVADHILDASNKKQCSRVVLVAGPHLLGLLRKHLGAAANLKITEIEKNLGQYDTAGIRAHLPERL